MARLPIRLLLLFARSANTSTFSYHVAWPRHFQSHPRLACTAINVADAAALARVRSAWHAHTFSGDAIVLLHSVFSNACLMPEWLTDALARLPQPKVYFIGNEYKLMPEKMDFCDRLRVSLLVSQSQSPAVHALYRDRLGCEVAGIPNTGLDEQLFKPETRMNERPIDLGYRADDSPPYLGHRERRDMADFFTAHAERWGLRVDISLRPEDRFEEVEWAAFLNRCKGQLGTEAGGDYFDLQDATRHATIDYIAQHPDWTFDALREHVFSRASSSVPLRILSGRNVEAAGTRTVQILFEGQYDGYFVADQHYIPLKKDFSNAEDAIAKFRDCGERTRIAENAFTLAREQFAYDRLLDRFLMLLAPLL